MSDESWDLSWINRRMKEEANWWVGREWRGFIDWRFQGGFKTIWEEVDQAIRRGSWHLCIKWILMSFIRGFWKNVTHVKERIRSMGMRRSRDWKAGWTVIHVDSEVTWSRDQSHLRMKIVGRWQHQGGEEDRIARSTGQGLYARRKELRVCFCLKCHNSFFDLRRCPL